MVRARINTTSYVERCESVHGKKYDYSKLEYVNMHTKVCIICGEHGEFWQNPQLHLKGSGCPECGKFKQRQTLIDKYGVDNPMKVKDIANRMSTTVKSKSIDEKRLTLEKRKATVLQKYGADSIMKVPGIVDKIQKSIRDNNDIVEIQRKVQKTNLERYGTKHFLSSKYARDKIEATNMELYGGPAPMCSSIIREKTANTIMERYGVSHITSVPEVVYKIDQSKRENNTYGKSIAEDDMYNELCLIFGESDVIRQYKSDKYSYNCDFYIKSRQLYVEFNGLWTHGGRWFDETDTRCVEIVNQWSLKNTKYYDNAISVWTKRDILKRNQACENNLNYLVFWDNNLNDFKLWIEMGCPDGQDCEYEYSWLPNRVDLKPNKVSHFTGTNRNIHMKIKSAQFFEFYKNELEMWKDRFVQMKIYINRWKYIGKLPDELTDLEILRAFKISGLYKGYSVFDVTAMNQILNDYDIKKVFDPCAGWGERMLCCYTNNVSYLGIDINGGMISGYNSLIGDLNIEQQKFINSDISLYEINEKYDAFITCPPYGDIEIYTDKGAENLLEEDFLLWWRKLVQKAVDSNVQYFCFQINQLWKNRLADIVLESGFCFIDEIELVKMSSHFNKKSRLKTEFESMLVFKQL